MFWQVQEELGKLVTVPGLSVMVCWEVEIDHHLKVLLG
jgi:hypothetical protein